MKDLANARAELARLQCRESELVQELMGVRKAVAAQKVVIDELVKARAIQHIERLPNELLAEIFLYIRGDRPNLVSVSRRWRAVIINTPGFWNEIYLDFYSSLPMLLKSHLERSRQTPLTMVLGSYDEEPLDVVIRHADRLRTLWILIPTSQILSRIFCARLPSLQYLTLRIPEDLVNLLPTIRSCVPALKHLELSVYSASSILYEHPGNDISHMTFPQIIAAESLEELSLKGFTFDWEFPQDNVQFPLLQRLALDINHPIPFLEALVAPKLTSICFTGGYRGEAIPRELTGIWSKLDNVTHITFALSRFEPVDREYLLFSECLCPIFRGIRHADIHVDYVPMLLDLSQTPDDQDPADYWTCLESLTIRSFTFRSLAALERSVSWFTQRRDLGRRKLHFKLMHEDQTDNLVVLNTSHTLYQTLQECCASVDVKTSQFP
ncbi:hypothetical protein F5141DRAFT_663267 [Pisolithus sp. B1]|nr:hypothetical protein F5141DRAFT_663267 [Pisolithus sp. B1]